MPIQVTIQGDNKGTIAETVVINNYSQQSAHPEPHAQDIEDVVPVEVSEPSHASVINTDMNNQEILDLLFRADDDDHGRTEILLSALIKGKRVKTKIVAALYEHRTYFNLHNLSLEDKTKVMNAWIDKLGYTEQLNGKKFTIKDW